MNGEIGPSSFVLSNPCKCREALELESLHDSLVHCKHPASRFGCHYSTHYSAQLIAYQEPQVNGLCSLHRIREQVRVRRLLQPFTSCKERKEDRVENIGGALLASPLRVLLYP